MKPHASAWVCAAVGAGIGLIPAAHAQNEPLQDEIVVITDAPIGLKVTSIGRDGLDWIGAQAPAEALNRLPGVNIQRNNGLENLPAIRSPVLTGGQSAGSFLVLEDGVPIRAPGFGNVNQLWETSLDFAAGVDVVRGPSGAAYGANAVHGLVNIVTQPLDWAAADHFAMTECAHGPHEEDHFSFGRRTDVEVGDFGRSQIVAQFARAAPRQACDHKANLTRVEGPPAPRVYLGVSAETDAGWRASSGLDRQAILARYEGLAGDLKIDATFSAQNLNQETASFIEGPDAFKNAALARSNPTPEAYRDTRLARARATMSSQDVNGRRWEVTPFLRFIEADLNLSFFPSRAQEVTRQVGGGVQARFESEDWLIGLDVDQTRGSLREFQSRPTIGSFTQGLHYNYKVDMSVFGAFGEYHTVISHDWRLRAGLRAEWVRYDYDNLAPDTDIGRFRRAADRVDEFSSLTPKISLQREFLDGEGYISIVRGARPPQITDLYSLQTTQTPGGQGVETMDALEIGWRGAIDGIDLDLAAYHMDKDGGSFRNADGFTVNNTTTRHLGMELSANWRLNEAFLLSGWTAYARHTYQFSDPSSRLGESIRQGDDIDTAPRWTGNLRARFTPRAGLDGEIEWSHMGAYFTNAANTRRYEGHDLVTVRALWAVSDQVGLGLTIRNALDAVYADRADFAFGQDRFFPGEPRTVTVRLSMRP
jgi:iron complex outermembrane receptor protein